MDSFLKVFKHIFTGLLSRQVQFIIILCQIHKTIAAVKIIVEVHNDPL